MAYIPKSDSVVAFQGNPSVLQTLVSGSVSVTNTVGTSIIGTVPITSGGVLNVDVIGSVITTGTANQSISGAVQIAGNSPTSIAGVKRLDEELIGSSLGLIAQTVIHGKTSAGGGGYVDVKVSPSGAIQIGGTIDQVLGQTSVVGTLGASVIGTVPITQSGTIISSLVSTVPSSVIVGASIFGLAPVNVTNTNLNVAGSVVAFQGSAPWANTNVGSVISVGQSSYATVIIGGSILTSSTANQSVSGTVDVTQVTDPWRITGNNASIIVLVQGSVATSGVPAANQSVSGTVQTEQTGTVITSLVSTVPSSVIVGASIFGLPPVNVVNTNLNVAGSVVAFQGDSPWANTNVGSVISVGQSSYATVIIGGSILTSSTANQSVSGTIDTAQIGTWRVSVISSTPSSLLAGVSVIGLTPVAVTNTPSISGTVLIGGTPNVNTAGSVVSFQGDIPWIITGSVQGSFSPSGNQSVSGTVQTEQTGTVVTSLVSTIPSSVIVGSSIFGQLPGGTAVLGSVAALQGTNPWAIAGNNASIIVLVQGSVATSGVPAANQSVSGTVQTEQTGTVITSLVSTIPSSVIVGASIFGLPPVNVTNTNLNVGGSVISFQGGTTISSLVSTVPSSVIVGASIFGQLPAGTAPLGSVAALQGTNPWLMSFGNSSIIAVPVGSVITVLQGPSIVGTYAEDAAHTNADKGLFVLGVRNDTMASISSADFDYTPVMVGPVGETIAANAPITKWVRGTATMTNGASVAVIAAQGASIFTYITAVQVANFGSTSVLVTLSGATSSIVGYTIAPQGGGSNIYYPNALKTRQNAAFSASISGAASVYLSAQGFIAKE